MGVPNSHENLDEGTDGPSKTPSIFGESSSKTPSIFGDDRHYSIFMERPTTMRFDYSTVGESSKEESDGNKIELSYIKKKLEL